MTRYTYAQLESLWINAGGPAGVAPIAAAIAEAESNGSDTAMNYTDNGGTQTSVGIWQLSSGTHSYPGAWTTAAGNASGAVTKYRNAGNSFSPWGTYYTGAYKRFLNGSTTPDPNGIPPGGGVSPPGGGSAGAPAAVETVGSKLPAGCLMGIPPINLHITSTPSVCIIEKSWMRALLGGLIMLTGGVVGLVALRTLAGNPPSMASGIGGTLSDIRAPRGKPGISDAAPPSSMPPPSGPSGGGGGGGGGPTLPKPPAPPARTVDLRPSSATRGQTIPNPRGGGNGHGSGSMTLGQAFDAAAGGRAGTGMPKPGLKSSGGSGFKAGSAAGKAFSLGDLAEFAAL